MATNTYVALDTQTLVSASATVTFSSIPSTYTDLVLVVTAQQSADAPIYARVNGSSASIYSTTSLRGSGSAASSTRFSATGSGIDGEGIWVQSEALPESSSFGIITYHFMNYANTTTFKTALVRYNNASAVVGTNVSLIQTTSAISSITLRHGGGGANFAIGSTFSLYGIAAASATSPKATGGTIYEDATYWYHAFGSSGTFTPSQSLTADYLVVAGGGGGGSTYGGGGGAGGLRCTVTATGGGGSLETPLSLSSGVGYTVTIGAGGSGAVGGYNPTTAVGTPGNNSVFSSITSLAGGGGGGGAGAPSPGTFGSGGGGQDNQAGRAGTAGQGFAGGTGVQGGVFGAAGGGGAGAVGVNGTSISGGNGGTGVATLISGSLTTYAGGGGGGTYESANQVQGIGGAGGGGNAGTSGVGTATGGFAGTANRGGGGGGASALQGSIYTATGGNGGSGIVIVRYLKA
jgi:hypothetical protein